MVGMRAKMIISSMLARWLAVALLMLAPLACIEYCRVVHHVAQHAHSHDALPHDAGHDAPLADMQQLVHAVTDALPWLLLMTTLMAVVAHHVDLQLRRIQRADAPPTPPPKRVVLSLHFC
jgi:hypothetical protein